jgi:hypothetical protein
MTTHTFYASTSHTVTQGFDSVATEALVRDLIDMLASDFASSANSGDILCREQAQYQVRRKGADLMLGSRLIRRGPASREVDSSSPSLPIRVQGSENNPRSPASRAVHPSASHLLESLFDVAHSRRVPASRADVAPSSLGISSFAFCTSEPGRGTRCPNPLSPCGEAHDEIIYGLIVPSPTYAAGSFREPPLSRGGAGGSDATGPGLTGGLFSLSYQECVSLDPVGCRDQ